MFVCMKRFTTLFLAFALAVLCGNSAFAAVHLPDSETNPPDAGRDSGDPVVFCAPGISRPFYTTVREDWALGQAPRPESTVLFPSDAIGNYDLIKEFSIEWDEQAYRAGISGGAQTFVITGRYGPDLLGPGDRALWDSGMIRVDPASAATMEICVAREKALPFSVSLEESAWMDGYYPIFFFPTPHGGEVLFEVSEDGERWFSCSEDYRDGSFVDRDSIYSANHALWDEEDNPVLLSGHRDSFYRITVNGSAYEGQTEILTLKGVPVGEKPPESNADDIDGNRGGAGGGEAGRPGKILEEPVDRTSQEPSAPSSVSPAVPPAQQVPAEEKDVGPQPARREASESPSEVPAFEASVRLGPPLQAQGTEEAPLPEQDMGSAAAVGLTTAALFAAAAGCYYGKKRKP